ncbi:TadE/TadG family type IV pilus assembly protein [Devosia beringensis]|uniref:TadE/TadG family type IV pilus assembly protein n=1 Tax=Devosia beringensis TaxID=2657486 RepID=UPI00186B7EC6|nr:TadE/TadG family type IV pilus assembly protein [Devosia beringensis]
MATGLGSLIGRALFGQGRRRFLRDQRGATAVEFGLLALPFFAIIGAILETSVVFLSGQVLESAVQDTSRYIRTGQAQGVIVTAADFKAQVCSRLYGMFGDCSGLHVEVQTINDFNTMPISAPVDWNCVSNCQWNRPETYTIGAGSSIVVVQVYYKWPIILSLGDMTLANLPEQKRLLATATVFRNEPYS